MRLNRIFTVSYSATGVTRRIACLLAEALAKGASVSWEDLPFTAPKERQVCSFRPGDLVIVASPTYAGRLPNKILPDFQTKLQGNGALAVALVTYGGRAYDNSLAELTAVLEAGGFRTVAAGAFVGRHAFTDRLETDRPNDADRRELLDFAGQIAQKLAAESLSPVKVPGDPTGPYYVPKGLDGRPVNFLKAKPQTNLSRCTGCGACARLCPMGAIDPENPASVTGTCIKCQRCVRRCTRGAKYFDDSAFLSHVAMLERDCQQPKRNEVFL